MNGANPTRSVHTALGSLSHNVTNIISRAGTKDSLQALSTLKTSSAQSIGSIARLLAVTDKVDDRVGDGEGGSSQKNKEFLHRD